jgi:predicted phosphodiesterase
MSTPTPVEGGQRSAPVAATWRSAVLAVVLGMLGGLAALLLLPPAQVDVGPAVLQLSARPTTSLSAGTTADLGSLGRVVLDTHTGPVSLRLRMQEVHPDVMTAALTSGSDVTVPAFDADALRAGAVRYGVVAVLIGVAAGAGVAIVVLRRGSASGWGAFGGLVLTVGLASVTAATFRAEPPDSVRFEGALAVAPALYGDVTVRYEDFVSQVGDLTTDFAALQQRVAAGVPLDAVAGPGETADAEPADATEPVRMLVISDLHLNAAGQAMAVQLARSYDVDLVVNLGDDTDWGTEVESDRVLGQQQFGVPYLWIRGNHDSRTTQSDIASSGATVLDDDVVTVAGLRFYGIGDPTFTPQKSQDVIDAGEQRFKQDWSEREFLPRYREVVDASGDIDVVLVHDKTMAEALLATYDPEAGEDDGGDAEGITEAPGESAVRLPGLVVSGHVHRFDERAVGNTRLIQMGSTGGAGLRSFDSPEGSNPNQAGIVYLDRETGRAIGYDLFTFRPLDENRFTMQREVFDSPKVTSEP